MYHVYIPINLHLIFFCEDPVLALENIFDTTSEYIRTRTKKHLKMNKEIGMMLPKKS